MKIFIIISLLVLAFSSCDLAVFGARSSSRQFSLVTDDISDIPSEHFFYVNIKSAYYTGAQGSFDPLDFQLYAMDQGPGTDCKISANEQSSTEDLYCMLDIMEGDLYLHEIELDYNVPPEMCAYLGFLPHWHYNQEVGAGPKVVYACDQLTRQSDGNTTVEQKYMATEPTETPPQKYCFEQERPDDDTEWTDSTLVSPETECTDNNKETECGVDNTAGADQIRYYCQAKDGATPTRDCSRDAKEDAKDLCPKYNKSGGDSDLENCCLGEYSIIGGEGDNNGKWGGDVKNCIGGLARIEWGAFDDDGFPIILTRQSASRGVRDQYTLYPLIDKVKKFVTFPTANYFTSIERDKKTTDLPSFYTANENKPKEDPCGYNKKTGQNIRCPKGHPFLTWTCLDKAKEVRHRIHLLIREWNTVAEFTKFKESKGGRGDPDIKGKEGELCDYFTASREDNTFGKCGDLDDADDQDGSYPELRYEGR